MTDLSVIYAATKWPTNAHMIADVARMGYLRKEWRILDPTYGLGNFWTVWSPDKLTWHDLAIDQVDFRSLPYPDNEFNAVVFDPPYKLNGTPSAPDLHYGVATPTRWQDRMTLIRMGVVECARVVKPKGFLLVKCMDQVVSGKVVWQTDVVTQMAWQQELTKVDRLDFLTDPRPQPHSRQMHARRNYSTLLIFQK